MKTRCVLAQTHTLPSDFLEEVCSATTFRASPMPPQPCQQRPTPDGCSLCVPDDTAFDNTWLGSIGITVLYEGKNVTTLQFTAADQLVRIGERTELDAKTIKRLSFQNGTLTKLQVPSNHTSRFPLIYVKFFFDSGLAFIVRFTKNNHLDINWHNIGATTNASRGIVGKYIASL